VSEEKRFVEGGYEVDEEEGDGIEALQAKRIQDRRPEERFLALLVGIYIPFRPTHLR
jgi:hypothetical protein